MDQRGGCCIARYAGGAYDMSKMDRIMLRFRPIAPKPASNSGSTFSGGSSSSTPENSCPSVKTGRGRKRNAPREKKNSAVNRRCGTSRRKKASSANTDSGGEQVVKTLSLLPETPDVSPTTKSGKGYSMWLNFGDGGGGVIPSMGPLGMEEQKSETTVVERRKVVGSWVRVERVTDTSLVDSLGWYGLGRTDEDKVTSLDLDTCPGFVSDGQNRVLWMNAAFRRMVAWEGVGEVAAWVVVEEGVTLPVGCAAFTCRVRVVTCGKEKGCQTVPCDAWRMSCGGFAWRLDTAAALSLGR